MKTLNTQWKLIGLGTLAVIVIWAGSGMEARARQDYAEQSARARPEVHEAAIGLLGPIGLTHGQTLRIGLLRPPGEGNSAVEVTVFDCGGSTLINATVGPGPPNCSIHDLQADQLPQQDFDQAGRAEVSVRLKGGTGADKPGSFSATAQVFDNATGKTTAVLDVIVLGG